MARRKGIPGTYLYSEIFYGGQKLYKYFCSSRSFLYGLFEWNELVIHFAQQFNWSHQLIIVFCALLEVLFFL